MWLFHKLRTCMLLHVVQVRVDRRLLPDPSACEMIPSEQGA